MRNTSKHTAAANRLLLCNTQAELVARYQHQLAGVCVALVPVHVSNCSLHQFLSGSETFTAYFCKSSGSKVLLKLDCSPMLCLSSISVRDMLSPSLGLDITIVDGPRLPLEALPQAWHVLDAGPWRWRTQEMPAGAIVCQMVAVTKPSFQHFHAASQMNNL